ncbi:DUF3108 domain-containing protein [Ovoidimarina sediminis]|uniref:DUF3108 domain-containing protein n=1 Tax=Ovoidimarina sediminis TaxID=3079856 RepID=UPI00290B95A4|nr:DUF3108 domain-containing protein [Rhodophyticola sp. MJ-SS7]MDU8942882.1 DUF3108 domain-containing protein [Rhodophyticola sp. MJ-SS7]
MTEFSRAVFAAVFVLLAGMAGAEERESIFFDVKLSGFKAGELQIEALTTADRYALAGRLESTGLLNVVRKVRFDARSEGRTGAFGIQPTRYEEETNTGSRESAATMEFRRGVPQVRETRPPKPPGPLDVDPATQGGSLDPLSALYAVLRAVPEGESCPERTRIFDGRRATMVTMTPVEEPEAGTLQCKGVYVRVGGFSEEDLRERRYFPFTMTYRPRDNGLWQVERLDVTSLYGKAQLVRR